MNFSLSEIYCFLKLTQDEVSLTQFAIALADWLEIYHDYARPHPLLVLHEASKQTQLKTGHPLKGFETPPSFNGNGPKKEEEPPTCIEPPEVVTRFFNGESHLFNSRFGQFVNQVQPLRRGLIIPRMQYPLQKLIMSLPLLKR